jgi:hypothetical protein
VPANATRAWDIHDVTLPDGRRLRVYAAVTVSGFTNAMGSASCHTSITPGTETASAMRIGPKPYASARPPAAAARNGAEAA